YVSAVPASASRHPRTLHSFPTRRSSDLAHRLHPAPRQRGHDVQGEADEGHAQPAVHDEVGVNGLEPAVREHGVEGGSLPPCGAEDRKSTRLNSSHVKISYAVFCLKKKNK